jgi:hypothetical protein
MRKRLIPPAVKARIDPSGRIEHALWMTYMVVKLIAVLILGVLMVVFIFASFITSAFAPPFG